MQIKKLQEGIKHKSLLERQAPLCAGLEKKDSIFVKSLLVITKISSCILYDKDYYW